MEETTNNITGTCFVIQPFDKSTFDNRFDDHFEPAIRKAGLEPYRVDRDHGVEMPIQSIHEGIREADACLADITTNNPNVWYELGYALASDKIVVMVCAKDREGAFPFDVRHLTIVTYATRSGRDFKQLEQDITATLKARLENQKTMDSITSISPLSEVEGLSPHEIAALFVIMSEIPNPEGWVYDYNFRAAMEKAGFNSAASNLSIASLKRHKMVTTDEGQYENYAEPQTAYRLAPAGIDWLLQNQDKLHLTHQEKPKTGTRIVTLQGASDPNARKHHVPVATGGLNVPANSVRVGGARITPTPPPDDYDDPDPFADE